MKWVLFILCASACAAGEITKTDHPRDRIDHWRGTNAASYWLRETGKGIAVEAWRSALAEPAESDLADDATAHAAMEAKRAAQAVADTDAREQATPDMRDLKRDIAATIDGLQTNVTVSAFPAGAQRQEFRDLADYVTDLAREVQRLRRREAENERGK